MALPCNGSLRGLDLRKILKRKAPRNEIGARFRPCGWRLDRPGAFPYPPKGLTDGARAEEIFEMPLVSDKGRVRPPGQVTPD